MVRKLLGIDIGHHSMKLALCKGGRVLASAVADMPSSLMRDGRITSLETMGELLRATMKQHRIHASRAAVVLPNEMTYMRTVTVPRMTAEQLRLNIPYEFADYIEDEPKNYVFDYAMLSDPRDETSETMELLAVAAPASILDHVREVVNRAGMKLAKAAPTECAYISLLRAVERQREAPREYCILDLGHRAVRMFMFRGDRHVVTRVLEIGLRNVEEIVAEALGVDHRAAHEQLIKNQDDCQTREFCMNAFNGIAVELMRALNFYRFSNPDSTLADVWLCGGGAGLPALCDVISETLDLNIHPAEELLGSAEGMARPHHFLQAVGITMD